MSTITAHHFRNKTLAKLDLLNRSVALRLFKAVIKDSPVLTGRLRANWATSLGQPDLTTTQSTDPSGGLTINLASAVISEAKLGGVIWFSNSLPYVYRVEFEGWSHTKAPAGMVRKNVARFNTLLEAEAKKTT